MAVEVTAPMMHADEFVIDAGLVRRLIRAQFPHWSHLRLEPVNSAGTDNALFRLGRDLLVRLPRIHWAVGQVEKEHEWLPRLAPHLPLAVPVPLARGEPEADFPWPWSVYHWLDGENATVERLGDPVKAAEDLAHFVTALQRIDPAGAPRTSEDNPGRGAPLAALDAEVRACLAELEGMIDTSTAAAAWEEALGAPVWSGPPVWLHGDLQSGNLLARNGRLIAVIDFGCLGVGDPACDMQPAWNLFTGAARAAFRATLAVDDATWARGRGWALWFGLIALPYYHVTNPVLAGIARQAISEVVADHRLRHFPPANG